VKKQSPKISSRLRVDGVPRVWTACCVPWVSSWRNVGCWMFANCGCCCMDSSWVFIVM
jgi:hypothetical protein